MYAVKAIYNGVTFVPQKPIEITRPYNVTIIFEEPIDEIAVKATNLFQNDISDGAKKMTMEETMGCMRGQYVMSGDFDAPIEDFAEYMR